MFSFLLYNCSYITIITIHVFLCFVNRKQRKRPPEIFKCFYAVVRSRRTIDCKSGFERVLDPVMDSRNSSIRADNKAQKEHNMEY